MARQRAANPLRLVRIQSGTLKKEKMKKAKEHKTVLTGTFESGRSTFRAENHSIKFPSLKTVKKMLKQITNKKK